MNTIPQKYCLAVYYSEVLSIGSSILYHHISLSVRFIKSLSPTSIIGCNLVSQLWTSDCWEIIIKDDWRILEHKEVWVEVSARQCMSHREHAISIATNRILNFLLCLNICILYRYCCASLTLAWKYLISNWITKWRSIVHTVAVIVAIVVTICYALMAVVVIDGYSSTVWKC